MKKKRFDRLVASLEDVREHVRAGRFAGRLTDVTLEAEDIRAVRALGVAAAPSKHRPRSARRAA
jgi:hypothetical protein